MKTHSGARFGAWVDDLRRDLLYALRTLSKAPAFTAVAVLTLALGIGAVTVIYSVVHNVVVDPLPYRDAGRLVNVFVKDSQSPRVRGAFAVPELLALREGTSAFEDVIGTLGQLMTYERSDGVESLRGVWVTPNFFDFMGIEPLLGRTAGPADTTPDAPAVVVLRHRAWVRYFAADPGVVGTTILLNGERRTVIGVMPPRFTWHAADLWMPAPLDRAAANAATTIRNFQARLGPGVTLQQAEAQLDAAAQARAREYPQDYPEKFRMQVVNVIEYTVGPFSGVLYTALAAVGLLLLIACCNVANMLLSRATTREREMMIRTALGAGRGRILRQLMVESLLLAMAGALFGCLFAYIGIGALVARLPQSPLPGEVDITLNTPVLLFSLGAAVLSAVLFGLTPALFTARRNPGDGLKGAGRAIAGGGSGHFRHALVAAEIALSLVLILSAGLLMRSFNAVMSVEPGFEPDNLLVVPVALPARYASPAERHRFYQQSIERIGSLPGVTAVAATTSIPPFEGGPGTPIEIPGEPTPKDSTAVVQSVTADYFSALGIHLRAGNHFADLAAGEAPQQTVVNQAFVSEYLAGKDPLGKTVRLRPTAGPPDPARHGAFEIVGVVGDVKNRGLRQPAAAHVYLPWSTAGRSSPLILVRTTTSPVNSVSAIRHELAGCRSAGRHRPTADDRRNTRSVVLRSATLQPPGAGHLRRRGGRARRDRRVQRDGVYGVTSEEGNRCAPGARRQPCTRVGHHSSSWRPAAGGRGCGRRAGELRHRAAAVESALERVASRSADDGRGRFSGLARRARRLLSPRPSRDAGRADQRAARGVISFGGSLTVPGLRAFRLQAEVAA